MDMYYVATAERSVLVCADDEASAWIAGHDVLHSIQAEICERTGLETAVEIRTVRLATTDEISKWSLDEEMLAQAAVLHVPHHV